MEEKMDVDKPAIVIDLPIFEYIRDAQLQHGLKYDDHRQYRSFCSRRIHRIRRSLNVIQGIAPSAKARHTRARKLMDISNGMVLEAGEKNKDYAERMLVIPLFLADRAWSYAMQLKQEVSECPRRRFHLVRRLEKASEHATRFEKLVHDEESPCSERTKKEATAYAAYINGLYKMERENWADAKEDFHKSLVLYTTLSLSVKNETFLEQYRLRIEELRASLRYCTFTLGEKPAASKVKLPSTLQFHDLAFRHVRHIQEQEAKQAAAAPVSSPKSGKVVAPAASTVKSKGDVTTSAKAPAKAPAKTKDAAKTSPTKSSAKEQPAKAAAATSAVKTSKAQQQPAQPVAGDEEEEEDEFEETREAIDESEEEEETETESEDEDDKQQSRGGGVTGLVKGWLGGAWS